MKYVLFMLFVSGTLGYGGLHVLTYYQEKNVYCSQDLGALLFFDADLSYSKNISCANCHDPSLAFTDGYRRSFNAYGEVLQMNAPSLHNISDNQYFNWSSPSVKSIQQQLTGPLYNSHPLEMGWKGHKREILKRLACKTEYQQWFSKTKDQNEAESLILDALACFIESLESRSSPFDSDSSILHSPGFIAFKASGCNTCHGGIDFDLTGDEQDFYEVISDEKCEIIRSPTLRNVSITSPYFHDGRYTNLESTINGHFLHMAEMKKFLKPTPNEIKEIIRFLHNLTDTTYISRFHVYNAY